MVRPLISYKTIVVGRFEGGGSSKARLAFWTAGWPRYTPKNEPRRGSGTVCTCKWTLALFKASIELLLTPIRG